ncbi:DUF4279 domain-containing protein [Leifsonia sp. Leaf264]|uniref:DUF4279 domain-containing protein n=1 Tax=Leifsonia sp. Leaf264 TaxID=1736314 RepID=UPI0006F76F9A|nr:DUF4279 domain-containing protein [Leifsonia sp. Leaf264]KQO98261.1 hypothetical protein ASF30_09375 [Leifsonia sp. Leaf264]
MVIDDIASLSFYSETLTVAEMTAVLGLEPDRSHELGDPVGVRSGRVHDSALWSCTVKRTGEDPGTLSLEGLLEVFADRSDAIDQLRDLCEIRLWWSGTSDSGQGGFVLKQETVAAIAALKCDLFGTVYVDDDEDDGDDGLG